MRDIVIVIGGVAHTIPEWAEISGIPEQTLLHRINKGLSGKDIVAPTRRMLEKKR